MDQKSTLHYRTHLFLLSSVFIIPLEMFSNSRRSPSTAFPNCLCDSATILGQPTQLLHSQEDSLYAISESVSSQIELCPINLPACNFTAQTTQKIPFISIASHTENCVLLFFIAVSMAVAANTQQQPLFTITEKWVVTQMLAQ